MCGLVVGIQGRVGLFCWCGVVGMWTGEVIGWR